MKHAQHFSLGFPPLGVYNKFIKVTNFFKNLKRAFYLSKVEYDWLKKKLLICLDLYALV